MKRRGGMCTLGAAALAAVLAGAAAADDHEQARELMQAGDILPLETILKKAQAERPGEVVEAELGHEGSRHVYEIELVDAQGAVWKLRFDAQTGTPITKP